MIRQRILYVGIGGSGLDLGIKLDEAMRREICGLDGRSLMKKGGPFAGYRPNQLPSFVQSLYIDFAAEALAGVTKNIAGGNSLAATNLIPTIDNFPALATDLRLGASDCVDWIPPAAVEPSTRPLNGGAGQFPTVGRAAFFSSLKSSGYKNAIGNDFSEAIGRLDNAMGELDSYTNQNSVSEIAVYVGFSMSGGTGCGIFLDVIQLIMHEMHAKLGAVGVVVLPIVMLPSTFDGLLPADNERRAKLNCARALLDLTELIEQLQTPNPARQKKFRIQYPDRSLGSNGEVSIEFIGRAPQIPVATLVSKPAIMDRNDVARSVAASIVAQASTVRQTKTAGVAVENRNSFIEDLINLIPEIQKPHALGLGTHPLMPMMSSSLTLPSRKIADIIAKQIVSDGLAAINNQNQQRGAAPEGGTNSMMGHFGLGDLVRPETFDQDHMVVFSSKQQAKSQKELDAQLNNLSSKVQNAWPIIEKRIEQEVREKSVFRVLDGLKSYLTAEGVKGTVDLPSAIQTAVRALNELETNGKSEDDTLKGQSASAKSSKKKMRLIPKKISTTTIASSFKKEREKFEQDVKRRWWLRWANSSNAWMNSVGAGRTSLDEMSKLLRDFADESRNSASADRSDLIQDRVGVVNFVPTSGRPIDDAIDQMVIETSARIRRDNAIQDQSAAALLQTLVVDESGMNGWSEFVDRFANRLPKNQIFAAILDPVRQAVETALTGSDAVPGTLRNLGQLLVDVASSATSSEADTLRARLGSLVPNDLVPPGAFRSARVLISYPGLKNPDVEKMIDHCLSLAGAYRNLVSGNTKVEYTPTGDSDVLTVNINLVGQGLLDNPETREILQRWKDAVSSTKNDQLKWRQRKGYEGIEQIFNSSTQDPVLSGLVGALFGGILEIVDGTPESPKKLLLKNPDGQVAELARVEIEIPQLPGFSSWPNILIAFERMVLDIDTGVDFRAQVVAGMLEYRPPILMGGDSFIPDAANVLLGLQSTELSKLKAALEKRSDYGEVAVRSLESAVTFWEQALPRAMGTNVSGGHYANLRAALDAVESKMRQ